MTRAWELRAAVSGRLGGRLQEADQLADRAVAVPGVAETIPEFLFAPGPRTGRVAKTLP